MTDGEYRWVKQYLIQQVFDLENRNIVLAGVNVDIDVQLEKKGYDKAYLAAVRA